MHRDEFYLSVYESSTQKCADMWPSFNTCTPLQPMPNMHYISIPVDSFFVFAVLFPIRFNFQLFLFSVLLPSQRLRTATRTALNSIPLICFDHSHVSMTPIEWFWVSNMADGSTKAHYIFSLSTKLNIPLNFSFPFFFVCISVLIIRIIPAKNK